MNIVDRNSRATLAKIKNSSVRFQSLRGVRLEPITGSLSLVSFGSGLRRGAGVGRGLGVGIRPWESEFAHTRRSRPCTSKRSAVLRRILRDHGRRPAATVMTLRIRSNALLRNYPNSSGQSVASVMDSSLIYKHIYQGCESSRSGKAILSFGSMGLEPSSNFIRRAS
jgi:hypothetical protein